MGDSFTNLLLVTLITLIGFIGKVLYEELRAFSKRIEAIIVANMSLSKDVQQLQKEVADHKERISDLENTKR